MSATDATPKNMQIMKTVCSINRPSGLKRDATAVGPQESAL